MRRRRARRLLPSLVLAAAVLFFLAYGSLERRGPYPRLAGLGGGAAKQLLFSAVAEVVDGDTIRLGDGRSVRLVQIDAPEREGECYGAEARRLLERLLPRGSRVRVEADPALDRVDRYGRLLAYVYKGHLNVNLELVRRGAAAPYFYRGDRGRYAPSLLAAARRARAEGRGLWGACPQARLRPGRALATGGS